MMIRRFAAFALVGGLALTGASAAQAQGWGNVAQGAAQGALNSALGGGSTAAGSTAAGTTAAGTTAAGTTTAGTAATGTSGVGGLLPTGSGLLGSLGIPSLSSVGTSNLTGVLSYCVQNQLVSSSAAQSTLSALTGQSSVTSDSSYAAGQQGLLQTGNGNQISLDSLKSQVRSKLCKMVLKQSKSLI
ncbi:hypothetical protein AA0472_0561 [Acetobacter estunensis NRIC 0472]|uniref:DUF2501 domain-containing protein n=1 Tax=Acetobacter estunensis TaxID=104097 RepID=A0A967B8N1_9PROT|nr:DUF2501 domain-containing protein [Acetobacter estunensis]NHO54379.1 DUF2501 domain-containing protein [Acetobacter estunensis]GBQ21789.1 hypothetical protein AA0472_0561 [Acetobacter estunensis NRIC 0472]